MKKEVGIITGLLQSERGKVSGVAGERTGLTEIANVLDFAFIRFVELQAECSPACLGSLNTPLILFRLKMESAFPCD